MPSFHVFPGGEIEPGDVELASRWKADAARVAAIRETVEECGLLLAVDQDGIPATAEMAGVTAAALRKGVPFDMHLEKLGLRPSVEALTPFGWWITPVNAPVRFDTRFFRASAPPNQLASSDGVETTEWRWLTPADAIAAHIEEEIILAPPTLTSLELLNREGGVPGTFPGSDTGFPICPHPAADTDGAPLLVLPGDPLYPDQEASRVFRHRTRFRLFGPQRFI